MSTSRLKQKEMELIELRKSSKVVCLRRSFPEFYYVGFEQKGGFTNQMWSMSGRFQTIERRCARSQTAFCKKLGGS